jgi:hypothetical protein
MSVSLPRLSAHYLNVRLGRLGLIILAAALFQLAAGVGLAGVAGFSDIQRVLGAFDWVWMVPVFVGLVVSFVGYYYAYRAIYGVERGPDLSKSEMRGVVIAGFGGFLAHGGAALDTYALEAAGADEREAKVRVACLGGLEHGMLSLIGTVAAIVLLAMGLAAPPLDFSLPWAVIPVPGFLLAFWLAERYRDRLRSASGWQGKLAIFLDGIHLVRDLFRHPVSYAGGLLGMTAFWLAESLMGWSAMAAFGFRMNWAQFIIGFGTGMIFTRRTGPLAGAGLLDLILPVTVWYSGAPFATAVVGLFTYRAISLWLPMPFALARLPQLRDMGRQSGQQSQAAADAPKEPALPHGAE